METRARRHSAKLAGSPRGLGSGTIRASSPATITATAKTLWNPSVVTELAPNLPIVDAERQLVAAYLGDLIEQILSEPE
jgi:hypothetical protein